MKIKTIYVLLLLSALTLAPSCASKGPGATPATVEEAEKQLAKNQKKQSKIAKKEQKAAYKHYWSMQSKAARKSIKQSKKRQKRIAKHRKKSGR